MSFLGKLFSRGDIPDRVFEISTSVLTDPTRFPSIVQNRVASLTESERAAIMRICGLLNEHINWHRGYLVHTKNTPLQVGKDYDFWLRSYFEFIVLNWALIENHFINQRVSVEKGNVLYYIIEDSFSGYGNLFSSTPFKTFDKAFLERLLVHNKQLKRYFSPHVNEVEYQTLSEMLIGNPLSYAASDDDDMVLASFSYGLEPHEQISSVIEFNSHFAEGVTKFIIQLDTVNF